MKVVNDAPAEAAKAGDGSGAAEAPEGGRAGGTSPRKTARGRKSRSASVSSEELQELKRVTAAECKASLEDYDMKQSVLNVIAALQQKFYQKFKDSSQAHTFFDVNQDGSIDQPEFNELLRYAGCWKDKKTAARQTSSLARVFLPPGGGGFARACAAGSQG